MDSTTAGSSSFLAIPVEIRLQIYSFYLSEHQHVTHNRQPSNEHIRLLNTCRQIYREAGGLMWSYISLLYEGQVRTLLVDVPDHRLALVRSVDVANDGRLLKTGENDSDKIPLSRVHVALSRLPSLFRLRVFECRRGLPVNMHPLHIKRFVLAFESAMFPSDDSRQLDSYELYLSVNTRAQLFTRVLPAGLTKVRFSGECHLPADFKAPALREATLVNVMGNYFDKNTFDKCFEGAALDSFCYALNDRIAFEIRDKHLLSLTLGPGRNLRKLVLLGCNRLSSAALADCLAALWQLAYFALSLITVEEQRTNFVLSIPPSLMVLKLHVINAWYAAPLLDEERRICDTMESHILWRRPPPALVAVHFRPLLMEKEGRLARWQEIARDGRFTLQTGVWEHNEEV